MLTSLLTQQPITGPGESLHGDGMPLGFEEPLWPLLEWTVTRAPLWPSQFVNGWKGGGGGRCLSVLQVGGVSETGC